MGLLLLYGIISVLIGLYEAVMFSIHHGNTQTFGDAFFHGFFTIFVWPWMFKKRIEWGVPFWNPWGHFDGSDSDEQQ